MGPTSPDSPVSAPTSFFYSLDGPSRLARLGRSVIPAIEARQTPFLCHRGSFGYFGVRDFTAISLEGLANRGPSILRVIPLGAVSPCLSNGLFYPAVIISRWGRSAPARLRFLIR